MLLAFVCSLVIFASGCGAKKSAEKEVHPIVGVWHYRPGPANDQIQFHSDFSITGWSAGIEDSFTGEWTVNTDNSVTYSVYDSAGNAFKNPFLARVSEDEIQVEFWASESADSPSRFFYDRLE